MHAIETNGVGKKFFLKHGGRHTIKAAAVGLLRRLKTREDFWALKDISFDVEAGTTVGIIGANGAGKSTLLGILARTMRPTEGTVTVRGRVSSLLELGAGFHPDLTGAENIYLNGSILGLSRSEIRAKFDEIVRFAELEQFIDTPVKHYSSGMYVRLGFAVAVEVNPDILLIDEVMAVGDEAFKRKCLGRIAQFKREGKTLLVVSHDLDTITEVSDTVLLLDAGKIVNVGEPGQVVDQYKSLGFVKAGAVVIREWGTREAVITAVRLMGAGGEPVERISSGEPLLVEIDYRAHRQIADPVFGFALTKSDGTLCCGSNTIIDNCPIPLIEGAGTMRLRFESLPLIQGKYYFSFSLHTRDHKTSYHRMDNWFSIWVECARKAEGVANLDCAWERG
ncbi:MAG: ABC transporter ATP-binding protein [Candidatus Aureabacteria bacterium]|nr:ABC transporter ATP-binding protein [Candidatus Auribacterota bacterium]